MNPTNNTKPLVMLPTILSSTGAGCKHIDHVSSQIPYTLVVAVCCLFGYIVAGFTANVWLTLGSSTALLLVILFVLSRRQKAVK